MVFLPTSCTRSKLTMIVLAVAMAASMAAAQGNSGGGEPPPSPDIVFMNNFVWLMNFDGSNMRTVYSGAESAELSAGGLEVADQHRATG